MKKALATMGVLLWSVAAFSATPDKTLTIEAVSFSVFQTTRNLGTNCSTVGNDIDCHTNSVNRPGVEQIVDGSDGMRYTLRCVAPGWFVRTCGGLSPGKKFRAEVTGYRMRVYHLDDTAKKPSHRDFTIVAMEKLTTAPEPTPKAAATLPPTITIKESPNSKLPSPHDARWSDIQ